VCDIRIDDWNGDGRIMGEELEAMRRDGIDFSPPAF
jgi:hypothetical protein